MRWEGRIAACCVVALRAAHCSANNCTYAPHTHQQYACRRSRRAAVAGPQETAPRRVPSRSSSSLPPSLHNKTEWSGREQRGYWTARAGREESTLLSRHAPAYTLEGSKSPIPVNWRWSIPVRGEAKAGAGAAAVSSIIEPAPPHALWCVRRKYALFTERTTGKAPEKCAAVHAALCTNGERQTPYERNNTT